MRAYARCTGHCCQKFYMGDAVELDLKFEHDISELYKEDPVRVRELSYIRDMLIPFHGCRQLTPEKAAWEITLYEQFSEKLPDGLDYGYTCKHFDGANCTAYADRPNMCKDYPYGRPCVFTGCTYEPEVLYQLTVAVTVSQPKDAAE